MEWQSKQEKQVQRLHSILRKKGPVHYSKVDDTWHVLTHKECSEILKNSEDFSNVPLITNRVTPVDHLLNLDAPDHTRIRKFAVTAFSQANLGKHLPNIRKYATSYLEEIVYKEKIDFVENYSLKLPLQLMCDIFGYRDLFYQNEASLLAKWARETFGLLEGHHQPPLEWQELTKKYILFERTAVERNGVLSDLVDPDLTMDEIITFVQLLFTAGIETTTDLLNNILITMVNNPEICDKLRNNNTLIPNFIDEVLRLNASTPRLYSRWTTNKVTVGNQEIDKGKEVILWVSSANLDDTVFDNPTKIDLHRQNNNHLSFGYGVHMCVGQILAKTEAYHVVENLLKTKIIIHDVDDSWTNKKYLTVTIKDE